MTADVAFVQAQFCRDFSCLESFPGQTDYAVKRRILDAAPRPNGPPALVLRKLGLYGLRVVARTIAEFLVAQFKPRPVRVGVIRRPFQIDNNVECILALAATALRAAFAGMVDE